MKNKTIVLILALVLVAVTAAYALYSLGNVSNEGQNSILTTDINIVDKGDKNSAKEGKDFLIMLNILESVEIKTDFFNNLEFKSLVDYSEKLPFEIQGRQNPFLPLN